MTKNLSRFFTPATLAVFFAGSISVSAIAQPLCKDIFQSPLTVHISTDRAVEQIPFQKFDFDSPAFYNAAELDGTLYTVLHSTPIQRLVWIDTIDSKIPKSTEDIQYLAYNLMQMTVKFLKTDLHMGMHAKSFYVDLKANSVQDAIDTVIDNAKISQYDKATRETIGTQIEMIAAKVGPPNERIIFYSSMNERSGTSMEKMGADQQIRTVNILNSSTGLIVRINFLIPPPVHRDGPKAVGKDIN